jgi:ribulose-5-phosphate 4-epimerase/fuculose-1-phosphate aldolase
MAEEYHGVKFRVVMEGTDVPQHPLLGELKKWCGIFHEKGLAPPYPGGSYGNLSFRIQPGDDAFIITGTCMGLKGCLDDEKFVQVNRCDTSQHLVCASGTRHPSSESQMHYLLYQAHPEVGAIFHGHSPEILQQATALGLPVTAKEYPYGTPELALALVDCSNTGSLFIARNHGFVSLGADMETAGSQALQALEKALAINRH